MATDNNRTLIDRLGRVSEASLQRLRAAATPPASDRTDARPQFDRGARVIDLLTGLAGVVQESRRDDQTNAVVLRVQLADLRVVYRTVDELADDQVPAAKPNVAP